MTINTRNRLISGFLIGLAFIASIFFFRPLFDCIVYLVAVFMLLEWYKMTKDSNFYLLLGLIIIPPSIISLFIISDYDFSGWLLLTYFCAIWSVDTMAMVGGKILQGPKLAPVLSPRKTISGLVVGVISSVSVVALLSAPGYYKLPSGMEKSMSFYLFWVLMAIVAQMSDLLVSFFKRKFNVKDSGSIIPGHGGMLDRFDSIILTAPLLLLYIKFYC